MYVCMYVLDRHVTLVRMFSCNAGEERMYIMAKVGSEMRASIVSTMQYGPYENAVVVELSGQAYYTGRSEFWLEEGDQLSNGFLVN